MNERGIVILDSILVLAIMLVIGFSIIPAVTFLKTEVHYAKQLVHASEVAYNGASIVQFEQVVTGKYEIDSVIYDWHYDGNGICVKFVSVKGDETYCIQADQTVE